jgi:phosphoribosylaminoimidazole (AIR) synthetase
MKKIISAIFLIGTIFIINYKGYDVDPCSYSGTDGVGTCFAIMPYSVKAKSIFCDNIDCVEKTINETGLDYITGIYKIDYGNVPGELNATIKEVAIKLKATIKD